MPVHFGDALATAHHRFLAWFLTDEFSRSCGESGDAAVACRIVAGLHARAAKGDDAPACEWDAASADASGAAWDAMADGRWDAAWFAAFAAEWSAINDAARDAAIEAREAASVHAPGSRVRARIAAKLAELTAGGRRVGAAAGQGQS